MRHLDLSEKSPDSGRDSRARSFPRSAMRIWSRILPATLVLVALFASLAAGGAFENLSVEARPVPGAPAPVPPTAEGETLIAFVAPDASSPARAFQDGELPRIKALARDMGLEFRLVNVTHRGAPAEVAIAVVMEDSRSRSTSRSSWVASGSVSWVPRIVTPGRSGGRTTSCSCGRSVT